MAGKPVPRGTGPPPKRRFDGKKVWRMQGRLASKEGVSPVMTPSMGPLPKLVRTLRYRLYLLLTCRQPSHLKKSGDEICHV